MEGKCCKCEYYRWPDPQEMVWYNIHTQKSYCVFHAPTEQKQISTKMFGALITSRIHNSIQQNKDKDNNLYCCFRGTVFPWDVTLPGYIGKVTLPSMDFDHAQFQANVIFDVSEFSGKTSFIDTTFNGDATFIGTIFRDTTRFAMSRFMKSAKFHHCRFLGAANFNDTKFNGDASFVDSKFTMIASFINTKFAHSAIFTRSAFDATCVFSNSVISKDIDFESATLSDATFNNARVGGICNFLWSIFKDVVDFSNAHTNTSSIHLHQLSQCSLSNIVFTEAEADSLSFMGCRDWPKIWKIETPPYKNFHACEILFRHLKRTEGEQKNMPKVSDWHYREKLTAMKRGGDGVFEAVMLRLYYFSSGFGERALQALGVLLVLLGLSFLANAWTPDWSWNEVLPWAAAANATMATIPFAKDIPGDGWVKAGRGVWQFLIAVQFTLFALAVRNRFRR